MKMELDVNDAHAIASQLAGLIHDKLAGVPSANNEIMDVNELATFLKVTKDWVYKQVQYKSIPHFKAGKFPRFRRKEIEAWIAEQSLPSTRVTYPRLKSVKKQN